MSEIKVNKISPRTACGTTTLGDSGDTFTIPAGVTITNSGTAAGFGATGAASWDTTVKTTGFTAVSGVGYFVNTTAGAISVNLPAGTAGDVVAIKDYANTFDTNNVTLVVNGSDKIGGLNINGTLSTEGLAVTLVFVDATKGWLVTDNGTQDTAPTPQYVTATGGTITCCGDYKIHTFTGPGTFCVSCAGNACGSNTTDYLVVAGGGGANGGPGNTAGGAGGGGFRASSSTYSIGSAPASPLITCVSALPVSVQGYTITVGGGGAGTTCCGGSNGNPSTFSSITSTYGAKPNFNGGSGGGTPGGALNVPGGTGNTPPVSPPQGNDGGASSNPSGPDHASGGGGGAGAVGTQGRASSPTQSGPGGIGAGLPNAFGTSGESSGGFYYFSAGGGGGGNGGIPVTAGTGGIGGGGDGGSNAGCAGSANTGGGGGAGGGPAGGSGGTGGSGIIIIRYKFQN